MAVTTAAALAAKHKRDKFLVDLVRLGMAAPARRDSADVQPVQRRVDGASERKDRACCLRCCGRSYGPGRRVILDQRRRVCARFEEASALHRARPRRSRPDQPDPESERLLRSQARHRVGVGNWSPRVLEDPGPGLHLSFRELYDGRLGVLAGAYNRGLPFATCLKDLRSILLLAAKASRQDLPSISLDQHCGGGEMAAHFQPANGRTARAINISPHSRHRMVRVLRCPNQKRIHQPTRLHAPAEGLHNRTGAASPKRPLWPVDNRLQPLFFSFEALKRKRRTCAPWVADSTQKRPMLDKDVSSGHRLLWERYAERAGCGYGRAHATCAPWVADSTQKRPMLDKDVSSGHRLLWERYAERAGCGYGRAHAYDRNSCQPLCRGSEPPGEDGTFSSRLSSRYMKWSHLSPPQIPRASPP
ncbi:hypothetical protein HPB47_022313 [Ixodes persulcatus]|uniref:Uncharacterized protein n=1 Tax=Ixodes persulcatus TaxID=34615 RepID=A0AC60QBX1_IXOPE|nr:hypothetical protein HPB47_022313 [Ixodes persulcatus]